MESSSSSTKRARAPSDAAAATVVCCVVDMCNSDLSKCRDYHRRHKVCELHSKTPTVTIAGREQRFCQQCSRFHSLGEFDEGKRSCRKRLEGHNRRRRKPPPDSLPVKPGNFLPSGRGSRFMPFSSSPSAIPHSSVVNSSWTGAGVVKAEYSPEVEVLGSYPQPLPFRGRPQFPFLQGPSSSTTTTTNDQFNSSGGGLNQQGIDSALSLLSSSNANANANANDTGLTRMVHQASHPLPQLRHAPPTFIYNNNSIANQQLHASGNEMLPNSSSTISSMNHFQAGSDDGSCSANGPQQTVSFLWE